jgi:Domain of unknown function (DUF4160)
VSPVVLRQDGFQYIVFPNDHSPAHVHVRRAEKLARVKLDPVELWDYAKFNSRELSVIISVVKANQQKFLAEWDSYHSTR